MKRAASSVELLTRIGLSRMLSASMVISTISPATIPPFQTRHFKSGHSRVVLNLTEVVASANAGRVLTQYQSEFLIGGALSGTQPPTEFQKLIASAWLSSDEKNWIARLLEKKSIANEAQTISVDRPRVETIQAELERYKSAAELVAVPTKSNIVELDEFFREWIERT